MLKNDQKTNPSQPSELSDKEWAEVLKYMRKKVMIKLQRSGKDIEDEEESKRIFRKNSAQFVEKIKDLYSDDSMGEKKCTLKAKSPLDQKEIYYVVTFDLTQDALDNWKLADTSEVTLVDPNELLSHKEYEEEGESEENEAPQKMYTDLSALSDSGEDPRTFYDSDSKLSFGSALEDTDKYKLDLKSKKLGSAKKKRTRLQFRFKPRPNLRP